MLLSDRMRAVAGLVQPCKSMADIGCDHGYVAMELVKSNVCRHVIAMDINRGPLDRAKRNIADFCLQDYIETRLSDGVSALRAGMHSTDSSPSPGYLFLTVGVSYILWL